MRTAVFLLVAALTACSGGATAEEERVDSAVADAGSDTANTAEDTASEVEGDTALPPSPKCAAAASACTTAADCCSGNCAGGKCQMLGVASLDDDRDRVLETYAGVQAVADRCAAWSKLDDVQKGIFLTHTDMLGNRSCMENAGACTDLALAHVFKLWAINGSDPTCSCTKTSTGYNCCNGGGEWHRIFFTADDLVIQYLRNVSAGLPEWGASSDLAGPHDPFSQSDETGTGSPRGQVHFWAKDSDASTLTRNGVKGVSDAHIVELDNDYNILHDSNPEGCYGVFGLGCSYGRVVFKKSWSGKGNKAATTFRGNGEPSAISELASDAIYSPKCPTAKITSTSTPVRAGAVVTLTGTGFKTGNVVHFRARAGEVVLGAAFIVSESATELRVQLPAESPTGEAYAWVVVDGVLSNLLPISIEK
jgi:hypothetical protein